MARQYDPNSLPSDDDAYVRIGTVLRVYPVSRSTLYEQISAGQFPAPVKLGERIAAWRVGSLRARLREISGAEAAA